MLPGEERCDGGGHRSEDLAQIKTMSATLKQQFAVLALIRVPLQLQPKQQQHNLQKQLQQQLRKQVGSTPKRGSQINFSSLSTLSSDRVSNNFFFFWHVLHFYAI